MTWPTVAITTTNLDAGSDSPATARSDLLDAVTKQNQMIAHVSPFAATVLDDTTADAARLTLGILPNVYVRALGSTASDTLVTRATWLYLPVTTETFDPSGFFDPATCTFAPTVSGFYLVTASIGLYTYSGSQVDHLTEARLLVAKNGAFAGAAIAEVVRTTANPSAHEYLTVTDLVWLDGLSDYIGVVYRGNSTANDLYVTASSPPRFAVHRVGS